MTSTFWYVSVYDESGNMISRHDVGNNDSFNVALPEPGACLFVVSVDSTHSSDPYTLKVSPFDSFSLDAIETEPNNSMETADSMSFGIPMTGQLMEDSDQAWFVFQADAPRDIRISFSTTVASTYWLISVYDETGSLITGNDVGNNGLVTAFLPTPGTYFIAAQPDDVFFDDQYALVVEGL